VIALIQKWKISQIKRKVNAIHIRIEELLKKENNPDIEYGNIRKAKKWGTHEDDKVIWTYEVDVLSEQPIFFSIFYHIKDKLFSCYSKVKYKTETSNILQFKTNDYKELLEKLSELALNIPKLRERMLREYIYLRSEQDPRQRWKRLFKKSENQSAFLAELVSKLYNQNKISDIEKERLIKYIDDLTS